MSYNLYMNYNNRGIKPSKKGVVSNYGRQPQTWKQNIPINSKIISLDNLINMVLDKYKDNLIVRNEIIDKISIYQINHTIAKELNNGKTQKELTTDIRNYLYELLKKKEN